VENGGQGTGEEWECRVNGYQNTRNFQQIPKNIKLKLLTNATKKVNPELRFPSLHWGPLCKDENLRCILSLYGEDIILESE
jgi:hypothetical protein